MSDDPLQSMSEQEIRARFRCAPAYYLQAKLERKRALERRRRRIAEAPAAPGDTDPGEIPAPPARAVRPAPGSLPEPPEALPNDLLSDSDIEPFGPPVDESRDEPPTLPRLARESLDPALPGFQVLDAALSPFDDDEPAPDARMDTGQTQRAILEAALEDYGNWPFLSEPATGGGAAVEPEVQAWFEPGPEPEATPAPDEEPEPHLTPVSESSAPPKPDSDLEEMLQKLLDSEPDLDLVMDADPALEEALASEAEAAAAAENVTPGDFGARAPATVRVVSVAVDRKRPNMVRIVRDSSRLAG